MRTTLLGLALVFLVMLLDTLAHAQEQLPCGPSKDIEDNLRSKYGETIVAAGVTPGGFLEILTNPKTQSFTILLRRGGGVTCILMGGEGFAIADPAAIKGDDL